MNQTSEDEILTIEFSEEEYEVLVEAAQKKQMTVEQLIQTIVREELVKI